MEKMKSNKNFGDTASMSFCSTNLREATQTHLAHPKINAVSRHPENLEDLLFGEEGAAGFVRRYEDLEICRESDRISDPFGVAGGADD